MGDVQTYKYNTLRNASQDLRVLSLLPGEWASPIRCGMETISLDDNRKYYGLSYVWGDEQNQEMIQVDGVDVHVTTNLKSALLHLRRGKTKPLPLWVDALCINQNDNSEKSHQIQLMGRIYSECSGVYFWLGCSPPRPSSIQAASPADDDDPFALLRQFHHDKHLRELPCFHRDDKTHRYSFQSGTAFDREYTAFCNVVQSPWWSRLWTVQEAILPHEAVLFFGIQAYKWTCFVQATANCRKHWWGCCREASQVLPVDVSDTLHEFSRNIISLEQARNSPKLSGLCNLLQDYGHRRCKIPRDTIFGLLALVDQQKYPNIVPNYDLDDATIFSDTVKAILNAGEGQLNWLYGPGYGWQEPTLPTWIRKNLAKPEDGYLSDLRLNRLVLYQQFFSACGSRRAEILFPSRFELQLRGVRLDTVQAVGQPVSKRLQEVVNQVIPEWLNMVGMQEVLADARVSRDLAWKLLIESFWRTMLGGLVVQMNNQESNYNVSPYRPTDFKSFEEWILWVKNGRQKPDLLIESSTWAAIYGRAFFTTNQGYMGLGYPGIEEQDEVWVLYGGQVPFILRRQPDRPNRPGTYYYSFVSDCYLDGFMKGEAFESTYVEKQVVLR